MTNKQATTFIILSYQSGNWYKSGSITYKNKAVFDPTAKQNWQGENRQRVIESCQYLLEETSAQSVDWRTVSGKLARTFKIKRGDNGINNPH